MIDWNSEKEKLTSLISEGKSYQEIGRIYGISGSAVKKAARKLGIVLKQRRTINPKETFNKGQIRKRLNSCLYCGSPTNGQYCNNYCQQKYRSLKYIEDWKSGKENGLSGEYGLSQRIRNYLLEKVNYKCECCGWGEINKYSNTIPLEVHHIDGDYKNNKEENLQVLCPNCHSLTNNYKNHKSVGRRGRLKYSKKKN